MNLSSGVQLNYEEVRQCVADLLRNSGARRSLLAKKLGVSPSAITRAASEVGPKWLALQTRIIEELSVQYTIETRFVVKARSGGYDRNLKYIPPRPK